MSIFDKSSLCPNCGSHAIFKSRRKGFLENVLNKIFFISPFRCGACDLRFFLPRRLTPPHANKHHPHAA
jgi:DNA-directed RNA polymerase subunit RPC12/RpoP